MAEETTYYSDQSGVRVTDKRVIIGNTTYSMANITSVTTAVVNPSKIGPVVCIAVGLALFIGGVSNNSFGTGFLGVVVGAFGYFWYRGAKPVWHLRISSASGESSPLHSVNQQWISSIAHAINEAIIHRA